MKTTIRKKPPKPAVAFRPPAGTIHRSILLLRTALEDLGAAMPPADVERLAIIIHQAMTVEARSFHTPEHVFDLVDPGNPHTTLAALFHDLVYYNLDHGFIQQIAESVEPSIEKRDGALWLPARAQAGDRQLAICMGVFGFHPGQKLEPFGGMNEFLSALVMNRRLSGVVKEEDLILSTACIEATIPFRAPDAAGLTPALRLAERLEQTVRDMGLGLSADRIRQGVQWAVTFANRDVANFAESKVTRFLDNTWKLLPESNPSLRTLGIFTIRSYRVALQGMEGFLRSLDPCTIFARYKDVPPPGEYRRMEQRARRNVTTACEYLGIKLLAAAILESLAEISGGDAPVALFMGDLDAKQKGSRLADYLPEYHPPAGLVMDMALHDLLAKGRASASRFDLQNSPLSLFIYLHLGTDGFRKLLDEARRVFDGALAPRAFLDVLPAGMIAEIAEACSFMAFTRGEELRAYADSRRARQNRTGYRARR
jgi:hypothetical protein